MKLYEKSNIRIDIGNRRVEVSHCGSCCVWWTKEKNKTTNAVHTCTHLFCASVRSLGFFVLHQHCSLKSTWQNKHFVAFNFNYISLAAQLERRWKQNKCTIHRWCSPRNMWVYSERSELILGVLWSWIAISDDSNQLNRLTAESIFSTLFSMTMSFQKCNISIKIGHRQLIVYELL